MKRLFCLLIATQMISAASGQVSCPKWGPYVGASSVKEEKVNLCMADVMIPAEGIAPYTYTCVMQFSLGKSGGYCGLQFMDSDSHRKNNNIFSIWDFPGKKQIIHTYKSPITYVDGFGNEGTGLHSHADFGWIPGQWYTLVVRRWSFTDTSRTQVAFFIYDHTNQNWEHYVTFSVPQANAMLSSNSSGFLENFSDGKKLPRFSFYKSYWSMLPDGTWKKPDSLKAGAGEGYWDVKPYGKDGVQLFSCGPQFINKPAVSYPVTSEDRTPPTKIIRPVSIYDAANYFDKEKGLLYVNWINNENTAPQLKYKVEVFAQGSKAPLAMSTGIEPERRSVVIQAPEIKLSTGRYYIKVQLTDIFDQTSTSKIIRMRELKD